MSERSETVVQPREDVIGALSLVMRQELASNPKSEALPHHPMWICHTCGYVATSRSWKAQHTRDRHGHTLTEITQQELAIAQERVQPFLAMVRRLRTITAAVFNGKPTEVHIDLSKAMLCYVDANTPEGDSPVILASPGTNDLETLFRLLSELEKYVIDTAARGFAALAGAEGTDRIRAQLKTLLDTNR